jgi:hypothetical protein
LESYAQEGLRTLLVSERVLDPGMHSVCCALLLVAMLVR